MIVRELKLKLTKKQEATLNEWLWILTGLHNWGVKKLGNDANDRRYHSQYQFEALTQGCSKRLGVPQETIELAARNVWRSWDRCFKRKSRQPRLKGRRNPLNIIRFRHNIRVGEGSIRLPRIGHLRRFKQTVPVGRIAEARIIRRASGWYCQLALDAPYQNKLGSPDGGAVGIDPGFSTLLTVSDGTKYENPRELRKGEKRIGQAQRGRNKQLTARLSERQANRRKDRNHKISLDLIRKYATIYISKDNQKGLARAGFGKSVTEAGMYQLTQFLKYKGAVVAGRRVIEVSNVNSTRRCCNCGSLSGPTGRSALKVRQWECVCGAILDRDVNAAKNTLIAGLGLSLKAERQLTGTL